MPTPRIQRTTLVVSDLERSLGLYRDVLGFTLASIKNSDDASYSYPTFAIPSEAQIRFATLDAGNVPRVLGLTEVRGVDLPRPPIPRPAALVLEMSDLRGLIGRLKKLPEIVVLRAGDLLTHDGRRGVEQTLWDADGHVIVLYEMAAPAES